MDKNQVREENQVGQALKDQIEDQRYSRQSITEVVMSVNIPRNEATAAMLFK